MATNKIIWAGPRPALEDAGIRLTEFLHPPPSVVGLTAPGDAAGDDAANWRLEAYFTGSPDMGAVEAALAGIEGLSAPQIEELPDIDWVAHSLAGLGVVRAGRFVLYGSHDADKLPDEPGDFAIRIDANEAFGTGHHPTTAGCLELLDRLAGVAPQSILDLGTGSGVLAIAAAKQWRRPVLAADIDAKSVEIARRNVALNEETDLADIVCADGFEHDRIAAAAPFDFVFANILARPLIEFAPEMARHVALRGRVMLAGLMAEQEAAVTAAFEAAGFRRLNRLDHPVWPVLLFVRV